MTKSEITPKEELEFKNVLYEILEIASSSTDLNFILQESLEKVLAVPWINIQEKGLIFIKNSKGNLKLRAFKNVGALASVCSVVRSGECLCGKVLVQKKELHCNQVTHEHTIQPVGMQPHGHYVLPIILDGEVLGILTTYTEEGEKHNRVISSFLSAVCNVLATRISILKKNELLLKEKKELDDSISYAKLIQQASFPNKLDLEVFFKNYCLFFEPKDIVSGDFIWIYRVGDKKYFALGDCSGHGVPGAFMTFICVSILNEIVHSDFKGVIDFVTMFNEKLRRNIRQESDKKVKFTAEITLCELDSKTNKLLFISTKQRVFHIREGILTEFKGDNIILGEKRKNIFTLNEISLLEGDHLILSTDGFPDQKGGVKGKKLYYPPYRKILLASCEKEDKESYFSDVFYKWKGSNSQVDDVTVFGVGI